SWSTPTIHQEPACGASYQPYGVVALGHIVSSIAGMALTHLTQNVSESSAVVWSGDDGLLTACGGSWTATPGAANSLVKRLCELRPDCPSRACCSNTRSEVQAKFSYCLRRLSRSSGDIGRSVGTNVKRADSCLLAYRCLESSSKRQLGHVAPIDERGQ